MKRAMNEVFSVVFDLGFCCVCMFAPDDTSSYFEDSQRDFKDRQSSRLQ